MDQKEHFSTDISEAKSQGSKIDSGEIGLIPSGVADTTDTKDNQFSHQISSQISPGELDQSEDWTQEIHSAFQPYARFVVDVADGLSALDRVHSEQIDHFESERKTLIDSRDSILKERDALLAMRDAQISELAGELEKLRVELSFKPIISPSVVTDSSQSRREESTSRAPRDTKQRPTQNYRPKRILLLDPAELNRVLISHYLKGLPVALVYAKTKEEAGRLLEQSLDSSDSYDLLLVDFGLKIEGEWISWIKGQARHMKLVAYASGTFSQSEVQAALGIGFDSCISRSEPRASLVDKLSSSLWSV